MESVEYRVLQIGVGQPNVVRLARRVAESKGASDSFEQRTDFTVEACGRAQDGGRKLARRDLQPVLQKRNLHQKERTELRLPGTQPGAQRETLIARAADLKKNRVCL